MSFQGYEREVDLQVGHAIPGADEGDQMMKFTQVQVAQIVSAPSPELTPHVQQTAQNPPKAAAASTAAVQQAQTPLKKG